MFNFSQYSLLMEGGGAGHMRHLFDLPSVKKGTDLIRVARQSWQSLQKNPGAVKIDGVNVSFKLIKNEYGAHEFAVDRGSSKPIDIEGITISRVHERFPQGHGMVDAVTTLLTIFNKALPLITDELKDLGMYDRNKFFNTEYVTEKTNVTQYKENFLAIHGINEFFQATPRRRGSKEVGYSKKALQTLADKVNIIAKHHDFTVYTSVPTQIYGDVNFQKELTVKYTVNYSTEHSETKTLEQWLKQIDHPGDKRVKMNDLTVGALSKKVYLYVIEENPLDQVFEEGDYQEVINGTFIYHATRVLGQEILDNLTSPMGELTKHEGVVIRDPKISNAPFKITGDFIVTGMQSQFKQNDSV